MKDLISKELLSEVLNLKNRVNDGESCSIDLFEIEDENVKIYICDDVYDIAGKPTLVHEIFYINIYELAHKCKEWSVKNGYGIASSIDGYYPNFIQAFSAVYKMHTPEENIVENQADTEPEAIFKACQWILDNKDAR